LTFAQIAERYGEAAAIDAGIAADPDASEIGADQARRMRPASEALPEFVADWRRTRGRQKAATKQQVTIRLDADVVEHFRSRGRGWQTRLNAQLRRAVFPD
jgi:uncharacterized protein (DUF4415 family)